MPWELLQTTAVLRLSPCSLLIYLVLRMIPGSTCQAGSVQTEGADHGLHLKQSAQRCPCLNPSSASVAALHPHPTATQHNWLDQSDFHTGIVALIEMESALAGWVCLVGLAEVPALPVPAPLTFSASAIVLTPAKLRHRHRHESPSLERAAEELCAALPARATLEAKFTLACGDLIFPASAFYWLWLLWSYSSQSWFVCHFPPHLSALGLHLSRVETHWFNSEKCYFCMF